MRRRCRLRSRPWRGRRRDDPDPERGAGAFLAPDLVKAAVDGRLPHGIGVAHGDATRELGEPEALFGFEALDRPHQADIALRDDIRDRQAVAAIARGNLGDEA